MSKKFFWRMHRVRTPGTSSPSDPPSWARYLEICEIQNRPRGLQPGRCPPRVFDLKRSTECCCCRPVCARSPLRHPAHAPLTSCMWRGGSKTDLARRSQFRGAGPQLRSRDHVAPVVSTTTYQPAPLVKFSALDQESVSVFARTLR